MNHSARLLASILVPLVGACSGAPSDNSEEDQRIIAFDTASMRLVSGHDSIRLTVELAKTPEQKTMGLMERHRLPENAGMLFMYDSTQSADARFWMFRTRIPLDIAFIDS
jgi:hypothetical protein